MVTVNFIWYSWAASPFILRKQWKYSTTASSFALIRLSVGKWGSIQVSGTIDGYKIESINLAKLGDEDKLISINAKIRNAINKSGGDLVTVSLYLLTPQKHITEQQVLETFKDAGVIETYQKHTKEEQKEMIGKIMSLKSEEKQVKMILRYIDQLSKNKD